MGKKEHVMKVLVQNWETARRSERTSLSKDINELNQEKSVIAGEEEILMPVGEPVEITIPDDSVFAEMLESRGTVFLNSDELSIVYDSPEYQ